MERISAIVSAYNAEPYILRAVMSLVNQSMPLTEIIVVDDGSTDATAKIIRQLQLKYQNLTLVQTANGGLSSARNRGLDKAAGDIIFFLDADDWYAPKHVESVVDVMLKKNCDLVFAGIVYVEDGKSSRAKFSLPPSKFHEKTKLIPKELAGDIYSLCTPATWSKAYRRALIDRAGPLNEKIFFAEDVEFFLRVFPEAHGIGFLRDFTIFYDRRSINGEQKMSNNQKLIRNELPNSISRYLQTVKVLPSFAKQPAVRLVARVMRYQLRKQGARESMYLTFLIMQKIGLINLLKLTFEKD